LTRDAEMHLSYMGNARKDGRTVAWLRDQSGAVLSCAQAEEGVSDQIACEKTQLVLADFPAAAMAAAPPPPAPPPAVVSTTSDADRNALAAAIDRAIVNGDYAGADRLLADATRRYQGSAAWPPLQQKLVKARAERDAQLRQAEARRLIIEARRFAQVGDFAHAEQMLQDADKQAPGFGETARARAEIASLRTERGQRYRERYQYAAAIDQAFTSDQLWEAERLLAEYVQRFQPGRRISRAANRLAQLRAAGPYQARVNEARAHIATARQAMERGQFVEAERQLALADRSAPGFPEIGQRAPISAGAASPPSGSRTTCVSSWRRSTRRSSASSSTTPTAPSRTADGATAPMPAGPISRTAPPARGAATTGRPTSCAPRMRARSSWWPPRGAA
jgi:hypothetical protein